MLVKMGVAGTYRLLTWRETGDITTEISMEVSQETKTRTIIWSSYATSEYIQQGFLGQHTTIFNCCIIHNIKIQNQQILVKAMDRENVVHVNNEVLFSHKEEWDIAYLGKWMEQTLLYEAK